jgi:hypothetical protein
LKQNEELQKQLKGDNDSIASELKIISSVHKKKWKAGNEEDVLRVSSLLSHVAQGDLESTLRRRLTHSLRYSQMKDRFQGIPDAHKETYQWLFKEDQNDLGASLRYWLGYQRGIFWIT